MASKKSYCIVWSLRKQLGYEQTLFHLRRFRVKAKRHQANEKWPFFVVVVVVVVFFFFVRSLSSLVLAQRTK